MKFLIDESVEQSIVIFLRSQGHDVVAIAEDFPSTKDTDVLAHAVKQERILITNDKDFGTLIYLQNLSHAGIVLFRLSDQQATLKIEKLIRVIAKHASVMPSSFIVIGDHATRVRSRI